MKPAPFFRKWHFKSFSLKNFPQITAKWSFIVVGCRLTTFHAYDQWWDHNQRGFMPRPGLFERMHSWLFMTGFIFSANITAPTTLASHGDSCVKGLSSSLCELQLCSSEPVVKVKRPKERLKAVSLCTSRNPVFFFPFIFNEVTIWKDSQRGKCKVCPVGSSIYQKQTNKKSVMGCS